MIANRRGMDAPPRRACSYVSTDCSDPRRPDQAVFCQRACAAFRAISDSPAESFDEASRYWPFSRRESSPRLTIVEAAIWSQTHDAASTLRVDAAFVVLRHGSKEPSSAGRLPPPSVHALERVVDLLLKAIQPHRGRPVGQRLEIDREELGRQSRGGRDRAEEWPDPLAVVRQIKPVLLHALTPSGQVGTFPP